MSSDCVYCRRPMLRSKQHPNHPRRASQDHIMPMAWGPGPGADIELRPCCQECNTLRAACGHCIGAMAAVHQVAKAERHPAMAVARRWRMWYIASLMPDPRARARAHEHGGGATIPAARVHPTVRPL